MIYFVQSESGGTIKIGYTAKLKVRLKTLEQHYGTGLVVLRTIEGGKEAERAIHEMFADSRIGRTEQFQPTPALLKFINRPLLAKSEAVKEMPVKRRGKRVVMVTIDHKTAVRLQATEKLYGPMKAAFMFKRGLRFSCRHDFGTCDPDELLAEMQWSALDTSDCDLEMSSKQLNQENPYDRHQG